MRKSLEQAPWQGNTLDASVELMASEILHVGVDTHRKDYKVHLWSEARLNGVAAWVQPAQPAILIQRLRPLGDHIGRVVYEAGPTGYDLVRQLRQAGFRAEVIAPSRTPRSTSPRAKCDRLDARKLAMYSAKGLLQPVAVPSLEEEADRQVARMREGMMKKMRRTKQQIKSLLLQHSLARPQHCGGDWSRPWLAALRTMSLSPQLRLSMDLLLDELDHLQQSVLQVGRAVRELAHQERHRAAVTAMQTTPGVGPITALTFRTELIAPQRFDDQREVTAMLGLAPMVYSSGQSTHQGPLMKSGNTRLRTALIEAAWRWVAKDPWAAQKFARLQAQTASRKKAIVAMARRLGIILWRISLTGQAYQPKPLATAEQKQRQLGLPDRRRPTKRAPAQHGERPLSVQTSG